MTGTMPSVRQDDGMDCLTGGGEVGALMRSFDWSSSPLGPVAGWPQSLRTAVSILINSRYPMFLFWSHRLAKLYNDGYRPILGAKHPWALGRPGPEVWPEIWDTIGPMVELVFGRGEATWSDDLMLFMHRNGYPEETYFTFSYSPIRDESGGIGGMFCACTETTAKVLGERRLRTLGDLAAATAEARDVPEACRLVAEVLAANARDLPFALLYLFTEDGQARLAAAAGVDPGEPVSPPEVALGAPEAPWPLGDVAAGFGLERIDDLAARFAAVPARPWPDPPASALALPIAGPGQDRPAGALIVGLSPRRALDEEYRGFLELVTGQIATAIANVRAYETERRRAEALAELDRAKTAFFSNVSHEFRTPLTLMLGPLEDLLARSTGGLTAEDHDQLAVVHRNGLRLLKLVNTLLDFSRLEAGRVQAVYEPTDLAGLTADLASTFRSAVERAGLSLIVDCPPLSEPVWVDRDMWEKIVLNLLSNAFKFTFEGAIEVTLQPVDGAVELAVRDTGTGIPAAEVPHLFERFHRVAGVHGRTYEGTGIGLALVQELVQLHGGEVGVASELGSGSRFAVRLPPGSAHLPADRIGAARPPASPAISTGSFVAEALRWLPDAPDAAADGPDQRAADAPAGPDPAPGRRPRILLVDDNADMRDYVRRLLSGAYQVEAVADGEAALAAAREHPPDLVLADVMMPGLDGFALLRELRADPGTRSMPVILLSARAGEESRIEGLEAGADDYLIKPFTARELIARVRAHLEMSRVRRESQEAAERSNRAKDRFLATLSHELRTPLAPVLAVTAALAADERLPTDVRRNLTMIQRNVELEARLIDDLLDLTRISRGKLELHRTAVDARPLLEHAIHVSCAQAAAGGRLCVITELEAAEHGLWGDAPRLSQAFWNLLSNAVKFTPDGGTIRVRSRNEPGPLGSQLIVEVSDTGIGIEPEALPRIFAGFEQGGVAITRRFGGLGLGLAIARAVVELHGGTISAASEGAGRGATFTVALPTHLDRGRGAVARHGAATATREDRSRESRPLRILLVEDHFDTAEAMAALLTGRGHRVTVAATTAAARKAAEVVGEEGFDVVVSDLGLPDGSGLDLMRDLAGRHGLLGIALSGYGMEDDVRQSREAGFARHLTKPVSLEALEAAIVQVTGVTPA